jgi:hypothetical protein
MKSETRTTVFSLSVISSREKIFSKRNLRGSLVLVAIPESEQRQIESLTRVIVIVIIGKRKMIFLGSVKGEKQQHARYQSTRQY